MGSGEDRTLGQTGLRVPSLCLGSMTLGRASADSIMHGLGCDERTSFSILNRALEAGVYFIDTADAYGQDGLSERVIGKWFATEEKRNDVVLATKFRFRKAGGPLGTGASRRRMVESCEASLRRLQTDRIDLYQVHMQDTETPEEETLRALDDLVRSGKVLYVGCSNYAAYRLADSLWTSELRGLSRFVSLQAQYNLIVRDIEREHMPLCRAHGLGVLAWSPLAGGFLTGKYRCGEQPPSGTRFDKWNQQYLKLTDDRSWRTIDAIRHIAAQLDATPAQVSLAWLLGKECVTSVIIGARSIEQLEDNLGAAELKLSDSEMARLDEASAFETGYPYEFIEQVQGRW